MKRTSSTRRALKINVGLCDICESKSSYTEHLLSENMRLLHLSHIYVWRVISVLGETQVEVEVEDERAIISLLMA